MCSILLIPIVGQEFCRCVVKMLRIHCEGLVADNAFKR